MNETYFVFHLKDLAGWRVVQSFQKNYRSCRFVQQSTTFLFIWKIRCSRFCLRILHTQWRM